MNRATMATEDARKLFVAGLPDSITEDVLREVFEAAGGNVVEVSLPRDRATGRPRGFGFVTLSTAEDAANVRASLDGSMQAGRSISVRPFSSEPPRRSEGRTETTSAAGPAEDRTLYVGNLPYDTSPQEVTQLLEANGVTPIVRVHLPSGPDGRLRGFGFITLGSAESANAAIVSLRGVDIRGRRLMVNIAHPRGAPGAGGDRGPRPAAGGPRPPANEGWPQGPRPERFSGPPPDAPRGGGGRSDSRRGRNFGGGGESEAEKEGIAQKKKKAATRRRGDPAADRGGGGSWQSWKWDDDD
jgi:RNA recognition motif-containing protein